MIARAEREQPGAADASSLASTILAVVLGSAAVVAAIGVRGDFPLSDDWSYAFTTRTLATTGVIEFLPWTGASVVLQAGYGALLSRLFGFSFTVLRASTIVVAVGGLIGFAVFLRQCGVRGAALAVALVVLGSDPLWVNLTFTFMTDVPFAAACIVAAVGYGRGLATRRPRALVAGGAGAAAALLIRQHGILLAAAAAIAALLDAEQPWRRRVRDACAAAFLPALVFVLFHLWLFAAHGAPIGYQHKLGEARQATVVPVVDAAFRALGYLGLLLSPFAVALAPPTIRRAPRLTAVVGVAVASLAVVLYAATGALMPYLSNVIYDFGLGALSLRDTQFLGLPPPTRFGTAFEAMLTVASLAAAAVLATVAADAARDAWCGVVASASLTRRTDASAGGDDAAAARVVRFATIAAALLFAGSLLHVRYYFDRYLLAMLPFAIAALAAAAGARLARPAAFVTAAVLGWYAIAGTHDYLAWNRARFAALDALTAAGVPATEIDGGFEFNAWQLAASLGTWPTDAEARIGQPETSRSWWWVVDDRYVASFRPLSGRRVYRDAPYTRWLVPGTGHVLILVRDAD